MPEFQLLKILVIGFTLALVFGFFTYMTIYITSVEELGLYRFLAGLGMQGKVYAFNTGDLLDILGFLGDFGTGALYVAARSMDWGQGAVHRATADYGTKFIIVA